MDDTTKLKQLAEAAETRRKRQSEAVFASQVAESKMREQQIAILARLRGTLLPTLRESKEKMNAALGGSPADHLEIEVEKVLDLTKELPAAEGGSLACIKVHYLQNGSLRGSVAFRVKAPVGNRVPSLEFRDGKHVETTHWNDRLNGGYFFDRLHAFVMRHQHAGEVAWA